MDPPLETQKRIQTSLARLVEANAAPRQIADATIAKWHEVESSLTPIIGARAVAALYQRSVYLTRDSQPVLAAIKEKTAYPIDFDALHQVLCDQPSPAAAATSEALLKTFCRLLSNLIGEALTQRFLTTICDDLPNDIAQDTPS